jgi:hypothetical protein
MEYPDEPSGQYLKNLVVRAIKQRPGLPLEKYTQSYPSGFLGGDPAMDFLLKKDTDLCNRLHKLSQ